MRRIKTRRYTTYQKPWKKPPRPLLTRAYNMSGIRAKRQILHSTYQPPPVRIPPSLSSWSLLTLSLISSPLFNLPLQADVLWKYCFFWMSCSSAEFSGVGRNYILGANSKVEWAIFSQKHRPMKTEVEKRTNIEQLKKQWQHSAIQR